VSGFAFSQLHDQYGTPDGRVWESQTDDAQEWAGHNPTALAPDLACTRLWLASGNGAPGGPAGDDPSNPGGYMLEHFIWEMNLSFARALDDAGIEYETDFYGGGYHGWPYWQRDIHLALPWLMRWIRSSAPPTDCSTRAPGAAAA
jgi:S-formylglutathione hydrolase FrmB